jgi:hypothetical protein
MTRLPGAGHLRHWQMVRGDLRFPRRDRIDMPGSQTPPGPCGTAVSHPMMLPSVNSTTSAPGNLIYISWLNGWPVNTPVNASPHTSRYATHDSGTLWIAGPSMVGDFHPLISTGLPAHTVFIYSIAATDRCCSKICVTGKAAAIPGHPYSAATPRAPDHTDA